MEKSTIGNKRDQLKASDVIARIKYNLDEFYSKKPFIAILKFHNALKEGEDAWQA
jgi:hypothetical protein